MPHFDELSLAYAHDYAVLESARARLYRAEADCSPAPTRGS